MLHAWSVSSATQVHSFAKMQTNSLPLHASCVTLQPHWPDCSRTAATRIMPIPAPPCFLAAKSRCISLLAVVVDML
jgi:hypothetical protein